MAFDNVIVIDHPVVQTKLTELRDATAKDHGRLARAKRFRHGRDARGTIDVMSNASQTLDAQFLEMRWRILSLAADFDRVQRAAGSRQPLSDPRIAQLRDALKLVMSDGPNRAEQVQLIFSDKTPPPARNPKSAIPNPQ